MEGEALKVVALRRGILGYQVEIQDWRGKRYLSDASSLEPSQIRSFPPPPPLSPPEPAAISKPDSGDATGVDGSGSYMRVPAALYEWLMSAVLALTAYGLVRDHWRLLALLAMLGLHLGVIVWATMEKEPWWGIGIFLFPWVGDIAFTIYYFATREATPTDVTKGVPNAASRSIPRP